MNKKRDYLRLVLRREGTRAGGREPAGRIPAELKDEELSALLAHWRTPAVSRSLDARLLSAYAQQSHSALPLWRRLLATKIAVPVPVFAAAVLLLSVVSVALVLRAPVASSQSTPQQQSSPTPPDSKMVMDERVEVPVERVVTRVVYVERERRSRRRADARPQQASHDVRSVRAVADEVSRKSQKALENSKAATTMAGFKPAGEVNMRIIKGEQFER